MKPCGDYGKEHTWLRLPMSRKSPLYGTGLRSYTCQACGEQTHFAKLQAVMVGQEKENHALRVFPQLINALEKLEVVLDYGGEDIAEVNPERVEALAIVRAALAAEKGAT